MVFVATIDYVNSTYGYTYDDWAFIEVYNEPDWESPNVSKSNMADVQAELRTRSELDDIPILGPSTLSSENAQSWYNSTYMDTDIGGCHVINGSMSSLINFINHIHGDDKPFINPEIHNYIEVMIAADLSDRSGEGGLFWGDVSESEGKFIQACKGKRIAYEMDPVTWSGVCAYRALNGRVWLFGGSSERHAYPSLWEFSCSNRDVFFDDVGPKRSTTMSLDSHEFQHIEVTWGDRNPAYFYQYFDNVGDGTRMIVDSGALATGSTGDTSNYAKWRVRPTGAYYYVTNIGAKNAGQDCLLVARKYTGLVELEPTGTDNNFVKWQLTQTGDDFYLDNVGMSRNGLSCRLKVDASSITLADSSDTTSYSQWAFSDTGNVDNNPPSEPTDLIAFTGDSKIKLQWTPSTNWDVASYNVYRRTNIGDFVEIADGITETSYDDDTAVNGIIYHYAVAAVDLFDNESDLSTPVQTAAQDPLAEDNFVSGGLAGGTGWDGSWTTTGTVDIVSATARLRNDGTLTRTVASPAYESLLYFEYDIDALEGGGDYVKVEVLDSDSSKWMTVWMGYYYNNGTDSVGGGYDTPDNLAEVMIDLSEYGIYTEQVRFTLSSDSNNKMLFVDDVKILPKTFRGPSPTVVYYDDLFTLENGWDEISNASAEAGDDTGGITVINSGNDTLVQMYSWTDNAQYMEVQRGTGHNIASNKEYTLKSIMNSGKSMEIKLQNNTGSVSDIATSSVVPDELVIYPVSFSTANGQNSSHVGDELGIAVDAGWWNNAYLSKVIVGEAGVYNPCDYDYDGSVDTDDLVFIAEEWLINYNLIEFANLASEWLE